MPRRQIPIEIFAPTEGVHVELPSTLISPRSSPYEANANAYIGAVQKEYGTSLFATGTVPASVNYIFEANYTDNSVLEVFTNTGMYKYSAGTYGNDGQTYAGSFSDYWNACMHNNVMVYGNGIDLVQYKALYNATGTVMGGVATDSLKAWFVASFKEHLNLYHTVEGATECPKRVRWTKAGILGYTGTDWTAGTAGFLDLLDVDGEIRCALPIGGGSVIVYGENSVHMQEWVGGSVVYQFIKCLDNVGTPSRRGAVANGAVHYFFDRSMHVYEYKGGRDIRDISEPIRPDLTTYANPNALQYAHLQYIFSEDELRFYVPIGTGTAASRCYICKVKDNYSWHVTDREYTCSGRFTRPAALTIGDLVGNIGAQNWRFGDVRVSPGAYTHLLGDSSGRVVKLDNTVYSLSYSGTSTAQSFVFQTKDLTSMGDVDSLIRDKFKMTRYLDNESRFLATTFEAKGDGTLDVAYSIDEGQSWTPFPESPVALSASWTLYTLDSDVNAEQFRVRFTNTGLNEVAHMKYIKVEFVPGPDVP